jgi:mRNA interferase RelE/StbE
MSFKISYDNQPIKFLKKQDKHTTKRLLDKIKQTLTETPVPHDAKSLINKPNCFRIRIGDFRALYRINYQEKLVVIFKLDKRGKVFKK